MRERILAAWVRAGIPKSGLLLGATYLGLMTEAEMEERDTEKDAE